MWDCGMRRRPRKPSPRGRGLGEGERCGRARPVIIADPYRHSRPSPPSFRPPYPSFPRKRESTPRPANTPIPPSFRHPHRHSRRPIRHSRESGNPHPGLPTRPYRRRHHPRRRPPSFRRRPESRTPVCCINRHSGGWWPGQSPQPPFCERGAFGWRRVGFCGGGAGFRDAGGGRTAVRPYAIRRSTLFGNPTPQTPPPSGSRTSPNAAAV